MRKKGRRGRRRLQGGKGKKRAVEGRRRSQEEKRKQACALQMTLKTAPNQPELITGTDHELL
jgi:hypothetical protein